MRTWFRCGLVLVALLLANGREARADFISSTLGTAGPSNYAILTLTGATDIALNGPGTTNGNVSISSGGNLQLNSTNNAPISNTAINGNLYLANGAPVNNTAQVSGTVFNNGNLSQPNADARTAAAVFSGLAATAGTPSVINGNTTIQGGGAGSVTVANVSGINLGNGHALTLNGPAGSLFVINSPNMVLNSGQIKLTGGVTANDVVFNLSGTGNNLQTSGGLNNESVMNGIVLNVNGSVAMAPGLINGELIAGGQSVDLVSGASVNMPMTSIPGPESMILALLGGLGMTILVWRGSRRVAAQPAKALAA